MKKLIIFTLFNLLVIASAFGQKISFTIVDEEGYAIPLANCTYRGHHIAAASDVEGKVSIARHEGWTLTISSVGFKEISMKINSKTPAHQKIVMREDSKLLNEVIIKGDKGKYSRKNNPAVELMKRVIAAKKKTDLANKDFVQYNKYQKLTLAMNEITKTQIDSSRMFKQQFVKDQVELCPYNNKLILPLIIDETVTQNVYRKDPKSEKTIILGENKGGLSQLIETGDVMNVIMKDVFTDVDIYDDQVRLLQYPFTSPIGKDAVNFYRFYIEDTVYVERDLCYHLQFIPNNQQDFGFRGELYVLADSTLHVKKCSLTIPKRSDVNFVENLQIDQEYTKQPSGDWVLSKDDMIVELRFNRVFDKFIAIRTTANTDYSFEPIAKVMFKGKAKEKRDNSASMRDDKFWSQYRKVELTKSEAQMGTFINNLQNLKGFGVFMFFFKALVENFVETRPGKSKVDIGPVNTMISGNFIDGLRTRVSAQTTANLNPHWFTKGYYAHGWKSNQNYYSGTLIYSFNKKDYLPREFPKRTLEFTAARDVNLPSDKWIRTDKDNMFTAYKWTDIDKMFFFEKQELRFEREEEWGMKTTLSYKHEKNNGYGQLHFSNLITSELHAEVRIAPGETFINTKQRRIPINLDAPIFTLGHTVGLKNFLGGQYDYHLTELEIYKRFWMNSWGKIDCYLKGSVQWSKVPYPLLIMPRTNLGYIMEDETFRLINNMEFLNDRFASAEVSWDFNGKIFNRIPLLKKLKWREYIGINCMWGTLTDKNNPIKRPDDALMNQFREYTVDANGVQTPTFNGMPKGCYVMDPKKPYLEAVVGIHNIFKILHVEYVRRLTYNELETSNKWGIRFMFRATF